MKLRLAADLTLDLLKLVDSRMLINANSGGGKSYLLRLIAERACEHIQTVILDPEGEFVTLREKFDFLLAGESGEIPCEVRSATLLARKLLELQANTIIDLYDLKLPERRKFVRLFLELLMHAPKGLWHPVLIMLDEAHLFCPERSAGEAESAQAVIDLMSQGRKRSFCGILATQRLSKLHKDAEAETNNVVIGRTWLDIDQERAGKLLGFGKERAMLRDLEAGTFYAFGPAFSANGVTTFHADAVSTTHPKPGQRHKLTPPSPSEAVQRIVAELADLPQQAEAEIRDLEGAKRKIRELEQQLRQRPKEETERIIEKLVEVPVLKNGQLARTEKVIERTEALGEKLLAEVAELRKLMAPAAAPRPVAPVAPIRTPVVAHERPVHAPQRPLRRTGERQAPGEEGGLTGPEKRILDAAAWLESIGVAEPEQRAVAFLAGYTVGGGAFNNPRGRLNQRGLIEYRGDRLALTDAGRALASVPNSPLTTDELQARVMDRLPGPERKILGVLLRAGGQPIPNDELAREAGYEPGGGAYNNPRGRLRSLGLIEYRGGMVAARGILFLEK